MSITPSNKPYHGLIQPPSPGQKMRQEAVFPPQGSKVVIHQLPITAIDSKRDGISLQQPSTQTNADKPPPTPEQQQQPHPTILPRFMILNEPQIALAHLQLKPHSKILKSQQRKTVMHVSTPSERHQGKLIRPTNMGLHSHVRQSPLKGRHSEIVSSNEKRLMMTHGYREDAQEDPMLGQESFLNRLFNPRQNYRVHNHHNPIVGSDIFNLSFDKNNVTDLLHQENNQGFRVSHLRQVSTSGGTGPDSKLLVYDPLLLNTRFSNYTPLNRQMVGTPVLESQQRELLTRVPSFAKVSTLGLNKKILFKHFKHGMRSTNNSLSRQRLLSRITGNNNQMMLQSEYNKVENIQVQDNNDQEKAVARQMMMEYQRQQQALQLSLHNIHTNPFTQSRTQVSSPQPRPASREKAGHHIIKTRVPPLNILHPANNPPSPQSTNSARKRKVNHKNSSGSELMMTLRRNNIAHLENNEDDEQSELGGGQRGGVSGGLDGAKYISAKGIKTTAAQVIRQPKVKRNEKQQLVSNYKMAVISFNSNEIQSKGGPLNLGPMPPGQSINNTTAWFVIPKQPPNLIAGRQSESPQSANKAEVKAKRRIKIPVSKGISQINHHHLKNKVAAENADLEGLNGTGNNLSQLLGLQEKSVREQQLHAKANSPQLFVQHLHFDEENAVHILEKQHVPGFAQFQTAKERQQKKIKQRKMLINQSQIPIQPWGQENGNRSINQSRLNQTTLSKTFLNGIDAERNYQIPSPPPHSNYDHSSSLGRPLSSSKYHHLSPLIKGSKLKDAATQNSARQSLETKQNTTYRLNSPGRIQPPNLVSIVHGQGVVQDFRIQLDPLEEVSKMQSVETAVVGAFTPKVYV
ncbi:hypothetical protein FGO68_gene15247 [Halteria grandinella]|uniref:Uncharacterized protein n=1 Tax=Halteria grandinella TaxID=5974 RepID=A0A8J8NWT6_HALGN|nr:hypothetical protein FGO68_gene15247 [Halteria grandinella]